jgi:hypothetical protein
MMQRTQGLASILLGIFLTVVTCPARASAAITFEAARAKRTFEAYVAFLERDPERYAAELATVHQLERSEVEYRVRLGGDFRPGVEGTLTTDGERVFVSILSDRDAQVYSRFSERSCLAHELEHARQFDAGELAFERVAGVWRVEWPSYDIGDEVRAWSAQLRVATNQDFWRRPEGSATARPSLLAKFAAARTDADRARVLGENSYGGLYRVQAARSFVVIRPRVLPKRYRAFTRGL